MVSGGLLGDVSTNTYINKHIENGHGYKSGRCCDLKSPDRIFSLAQGVISIAISDIAPYDVVQGRHDAVPSRRSVFRPRMFNEKHSRAACCPFKRVVEVVWFGNLESSAEGSL